MRSSYKRLGPYIRPVDVRNKKLEVDLLLGVSIQKILMPSIANTVGTDMSKYKIIRNKQFAYGPVTSRNGDKISVALLEDHDSAILSQAYVVFEVIDHNKLDPEYLMMWFRRPEFDRYARFKSHGSARETFDWEEMCEVELPIPSIEKQREIVKEYNTVVNRIKLNEQLNQKLEETAQALYKHWFVDFEFPDENGNSYKSSDGKMVWNEELEKEIPEGWEVNALVDLGMIKGGKRMPSGKRLVTHPTKHPYIKVADMGNGKFVQLNESFEYVSEKAQSEIVKYIVSEGDLIISIVGTIGLVKIIHSSLDGANLTENCVKITSLNKVNASYLYHYFLSKEGQEELITRNVGAVQAKLPIYNIETFPIICSKDGVQKAFENLTNSIDRKIELLQQEEIRLRQLRELILAKMTQVEVEEILT